MLLSIIDDTVPSSSIRIHHEDATGLFELEYFWQVRDNDSILCGFFADPFMTRCLGSQIDKMEQFLVWWNINRILAKLLPLKHSIHVLLQLKHSHDE